MILKIGGSVLTDKTTEETVAEGFDEVLSSVAGSAPEDLVLVHGAGSFGHPHAARHGLSDGGREGAYGTHDAVARLNRRVVGTLREYGVEAFPVHPSSFAWKDGDLFFEDGAVHGLRDGFLPVVHGDVVAHGDGASVLSGDRIAVELASDDESVGMCTSAGGVLDEEGKPVERISSVEQVTEIGDGTTDVTGGIHGKVERLLSVPSGGRVFGADELEAFFTGESVGTLVRR